MVQNYNPRIFNYFYSKGFGRASLGQRLLQ